METKFNFNSAICTSKAQSERLLALGLKKETADMAIPKNGGKPFVLKYEYNDREGNCIPAWSLARLVELMPQSIEYEGNTLYLTIYAEDVFYTNWKEHTPLARTLNLYEHLIWYIEWLIKEGYFPKENLV